MRRGGILHAELNERISQLGHTDTFVVGDCGLPVPPDGGQRVDLAVVMGVPRFVDVFDAVLEEEVVEDAIIAAGAGSSPVGELLARRFPGAEVVGHDELKARTRQALFVVRTGETTPYANVTLRCGVPF